MIHILKQITLERYTVLIELLQNRETRLGAIVSQTDGHTYRSLTSNTLFASRVNELPRTEIIFISFFSIAVCKYKLLL